MAKKEEKVESQDPIVEGDESSEPTPILEEQQLTEGVEEALAGRAYLRRHQGADT